MTLDVLCLLGDIKDVDTRRQLTPKIISTTMKARCLGSRIMSNVQGVSRKVTDSKDLPLEQCTVKQLFYALHYRSRSKYPATSEIENFLFELDDTKSFFLVMSGCRICIRKFFTSEIFH